MGLEAEGWCPALRPDDEFPFRQAGYLGLRRTNKLGDRVCIICSPGDFEAAPA